MPYSLREQPERVERVILHFGAELRDTRLMCFETQTHLSEVAGISQSTWSMIENGLAEGARLEVLARVAASLDLDLVLRRCAHPADVGVIPPNGRMRRTEEATLIPGTRRLMPGPRWNDR